MKECVKPMTTKMKSVLKPDFYVWYCKCRKSCGTPIGVLNMKTNELRWVKSLPMVLRKPSRIEMMFGIAPPIARSSGATTALGVWV